MKLILSVAALLGVTAAAPQFGNNRFNQQQNYQPQAPQGAPIAIISSQSDASIDGSYQWSYETANGIRAQATGSVRPSATRDAENPVVTAVQGSYSYIGDDGQTYTVNYIADENGYRAEGVHLPTPPPIPEAIAKSLDYIQTAQRNNPPLQQQQPQFNRPAFG